MTADSSRHETLQELEDEDWGEPTDGSYLVTMVHRLRRKPLQEFSVEDLRIMIGQEIGLPYLVPLAIERLEQTPLAEGDYYPGDLLATVLRISESFWPNHPDLFQRIHDICRRARQLTSELDQVTRRIVQEVLNEASQRIEEPGSS